MNIMDTDCDLLEEIFDRIDKQQLRGDALDVELLDAENILSQMKISIHSIKTRPSKDHYLIKMQTFTRCLDKHRKRALIESSQLTTSFSTKRQIFIAPPTEQNERALNILNMARRQIAETEADGIATLAELSEHRNTIQNIQSNLQTVQRDVSYSNRLVTQMSRWWRG